MIAGVQDPDVQPLRRRSAAESSDERVALWVADVRWESDVWCRQHKSTLEPATDRRGWPRGRNSRQVDPQLCILLRLSAQIVFVLRYDTIQYIYVCSNADEMSSLI